MVQISLFCLQVSDTRAPGDRSTTLMGFVAGVVREKYPNVLEFVNEVTYLEKAATGETFNSVIQMTGEITCKCLESCHLQTDFFTGR